jgi:hypothetical protein
VSCAPDTTIGQERGAPDLRANEYRIMDLRERFFVYIIESPSASDLFQKRSEGDLIAQGLRLNDIPSLSRIAISKPFFRNALREGVIDAIRLFPNYLPAIHISAHGNTAGISLSDGSIVPWSELRDLLVPLNSAMKGTLLLCMSACKGLSACSMAMNTKETDPPFFAVIGNAATPSWAETAVAYAAFYHVLSSGKTVNDALEAMKAASDNKDWHLMTAKRARRLFMETLEKLDISKLRQDLMNSLSKQS